MEQDEEMEVQNQVQLRVQIRKEKYFVVIIFLSFLNSICYLLQKMNVMLHLHEMELQLLRMCLQMESSIELDIKCYLVQN